MARRKRYGVIVADPPWGFRDKLPGTGRGAAKHYVPMKTDDIAALPVGDFAAPDCALFLWRVSSMVEDAYRVVRAWGFVPKTEFVWRKVTVNGKVHAGMGRYSYNSHESVILAVRGKVIPPAKLRCKSVFDAGLAGHSVKPEVFYDIVERTYPTASKLEMFARRAERPGWDFWGDQI